MMLTLSVILFGIAALGGVVLALWNDSAKKRPMPLSIIHGGVAAAGLIVLIAAVLQGDAGTLPMIAAILLVVAALGGFVLFAFHLRGNRLPKGLILVHGLLAVIAELLLILAII